MAINTYNTLVAAIAEWLARDDLTARIPDFVTLAEAKINRVLVHPRMETRTTLTVDTGAAKPEFLTLPTDFQTMRSVYLSGVAGQPRLNFFTQTQLRDYLYSIDNVSGQPAVFSIIANVLRLAPTPNEDFDVDVVYRANVPAITSTNQTNWLLTFAPDVYLYGSLMEAAPYAKNDARIAVWASGFQTTIDQLNTHGDRQSFDSGPSTVWLPGVTP